MPNLAKFFLADEDGVETSMAMWVDQSDPSHATMTTLADKLQNLTAAALARYGILKKGVPAPAIPVGAGAYDIADKVVLEFEDSLGNIAKVSLPAPIESIFTDSDHVNLTMPIIVTLAGAIQTSMRTRGGATLGTLLRGYRVRSQRRV